MKFATSLHKICYGHRTSLHYIRDKEGREVDFATVIDDKIIDLIEVKLSDNELSKGLIYYSKKLKPKRATQIVGNLHRPYDKDSIRVTTPAEFFRSPPWWRELLTKRYCQIRRGEKSFALNVARE